jgi:ACT domain-containing protein
MKVSEAQSGDRFRTNLWRDSYRAPKGKAVNGETLRQKDRGFVKAWPCLVFCRLSGSKRLLDSLFFYYKKPGGKKMKTVITVIGKDKTGIIANVSKTLWENDVNILDISQTIMQDYFAMIMMADISSMKISFGELKEKLELVGETIEMDIRVQNEKIFNAMHQI